MTSDNIGSGINKLGDLLFRFLNHKVDIQRQFSPFTDSGYYKSTDGYLRHKMPVHDIYVDIVSASFSRLSHLLTQATKISRENGRGELYFLATSQD
jgi:hypothetical protein